MYDIPTVVMEWLVVNTDYSTKKRVTVYMVQQMPVEIREVYLNWAFNMYSILLNDEDFDNAETIV